MQKYSYSNFELWKDNADFELNSEGFSPLESLVQLNPIDDTFKDI